MRKGGRRLVQFSRVAVPRCKRLYCENCPKSTVGRWFKKPVCPECRIEPAEVSHIPRIEYQNRF